MNDKWFSLRKILNSLRHEYIGFVIAEADIALNT
jgi:hypothetical protein